VATFPRLLGPITDEPYAARQKLVVLPVDELHDLIQAFDRAPVSKASEAGPRISEAGSKTRGAGSKTSEAAYESTVNAALTLAPVVRTRPGQLLVGGVLAAGLSPWALRKIRQHWKRWRTAAKLDLGVIYTDTDSASNLRFPAGHPVHNLLYIAHPTDAERYLVAGQFHRNAFEDKLAEAIGLLQALGAEKMTVHHVSGWRDEVSLSIGSEGMNQVGLDAKAAKSRDADSNVLFEAEYDPDREPKLPDNLHWFHDEPLWAKLAEGRLHANLRTFTLDVTYQQDFGIDMNLPAKVQQAGFKLGGEFKQHQSTHWRITGKFVT
jgi:hypothetical protein